MWAETISIALASDASGDQTTYSSGNVTGRILSVRYVPDGTSPIANGGDITITGERTGIPILTITNVGASAVNYAPRQATHSTAGAAALYAAGGTAVNDLIAIANERIKVVLAQGGASKLGTLHIVVG